VAGRVALDTSFLIDLQRERRRGDAAGAAHAFLRGEPHVALALPATVLGEFAEGFDHPDHPVVRAIRELHTVLEVDEATALSYARLTRTLRARGALIGTNDLWIAATCVRHAVPLVTANLAEFRRIPDLEVIGYR
jgi:predicted nucleic acid-binding protein